MDRKKQTSVRHGLPTHKADSGVIPMLKLIHRSRFTYGLFVLAILALSGGAGIKWG
jgi:hypothetical protein